VDDPLPFARAGLDSPDWTIDTLLAPSREIYWIPHTTTVPPEPSQTTVSTIPSSKADQLDATLSTPSTTSSEETEVLVYTWQQKYINHGVTTKFYILPHQRAITTPDEPITGEIMGEDWTPMPQDSNTQTNMTTRNFKGQCYRCSRTGHKARYCQETDFTPRKWTFTGHCYYCQEKGHKWRKCAKKGRSYTQDEIRHKTRKAQFRGKCHHCHEVGHKRRQCPLCHYCYQKGHRKYHCPAWRTFNAAIQTRLETALNQDAPRMLVVTNPDPESSPATEEPSTPQNQPLEVQRKSRLRKERRCFNCEQQGHLARHCPTPSSSDRTVYGSRWAPKA
jgi:Zinc knuckle